jgi:hypothetical protein
MILQASVSGDLAKRTMSLHAHGKVTRIFPKAIYLEFPNSLVVVLSGALKSPITVNVSVDRSFQELVKLGDGCRIASGELIIGSLVIALLDSQTYANRSEGPRAKELRLPELRVLQRAAATLKMLYQASPETWLLPEDDNLGKFVSSLTRYRTGLKGGKEMLRGEFALLIGRGNGFTPSGDDFLAGFTATYNHFSKSNNWELIELETEDLIGETVRESAMLLSYASQGYVDEEMEDLMVSLSSNADRLTDALTRIATRGHTSGLDMSLGALVAVAAVEDMIGKGDGRSVRAFMGALTS